MLMMLFVAGVIVVLFLVGAGLVGFGIVLRRRAVPAEGVNMTPARGSALLMGVGALLLLISLGACAYAVYLMLSISR